MEVHLPELAFLRFSVVDVGSNCVTAQRVVPVTRLLPGYRHLRLHNELDLPLPLSQLFLCTQFMEGDLVDARDQVNGEGEIFTLVMKDLRLSDGLATSLKKNCRFLCVEIFLNQVMLYIYV